MASRGCSFDFRFMDFSFFIASGMDGQLERLCSLDVVQYFVHGDISYKRRAFLDLPCSGSSLIISQSTANKGVIGAMVTVERLYKIKKCRTGRLRITRGSCALDSVLLDWTIFLQPF